MLSRPIFPGAMLAMALFFPALAHSAGTPPPPLPPLSYPTQEEMAQRLRDAQAEFDRIMDAELAKAMPPPEGPPSLMDIRQSLFKLAVAKAPKGEGASEWVAKQYDRVAKVEASGCRDEGNGIYTCSITLDGKAVALRVKAQPGGWQVAQ